MRRLDRDVDAWVATGDAAGGRPYVVPLSFLWDGDALLVATPASSVTGRNLAATGVTRIGIGPTRDVVVIDATAHPLDVDDLAPGLGDAFAAKTGFDPRRLDGYVYIRLHPRRVQAWREVDELPGRELMRDGRWAVADDEEEQTRAETDGATAPPAVPSHPGGTDDLRPVGWVASALAGRAGAPMQPDEGAPPARIVLRPELSAAAADLAVGDRVVVLTWLHAGARDVLAVHPRGDETRPLTGVFSTRAPDRPNPIGLHEATIVEVAPDAVVVDHLEAIDGTPVLDIKPVLGSPAGR